MPHSLTTLKDSATQLLIKYKSGALVTQYKISLFPAHCDIRSTLWSIFLTMYQYFQDTVINISNRNINISSTWTTLRSLWRLSVILGSRWWSWVSLQGGTSTRLRLNSQFWKRGPTYTAMKVKYFGNWCFRQRHCDNAPRLSALAVFWIGKSIQWCFGYRQVHKIHTFYLSQTPETCLCKNFLSGVNFSRMSEKNAYIWLFQRHF